MDGDIKHSFQIHNHNTRGKIKFFIKGYDTALYQKSVTNISVEPFNKLLARIRAINKFKGFKKEVRSQLLNNTFYSVDEFLHSEFM